MKVCILFVMHSIAGTALCCFSFILDARSPSPGIKLPSKITFRYLFFIRPLVRSFTSATLTRSVFETRTNRRTKKSHEKYSLYLTDDTRTGSWCFVCRFVHWHSVRCLNAAIGNVCCSAEFVARSLLAEDSAQRNSIAYDLATRYRKV